MREGAIARQNGKVIGDQQVVDFYAGSDSLPIAILLRAVAVSALNLGPRNDFHRFWRAPASSGVSLAIGRRGGTVTQRNIEVVIGRLMTDEEFRQTFVSDPQKALGELFERGTHLTAAEIAALIAVDCTLWGRVAEQIDPRLQKASLKASEAPPLAAVAPPR